MNSCKKPGVAFWATVVVVMALVAYPLSFGPACWISSRAVRLVPATEIVYRPVMWAWDMNGHPVGTFLNWYSRVGAVGGRYWTGENRWVTITPEFSGCVIYHLGEDAELSSDTGAGVPDAPQTDDSELAQAVGTGLERPATGSKAIIDAVGAEIDIEGRWAGFSFFWGSASLTVKRDDDSESKYILHFMRQTDLLDTEYFRSATFENGFLKMNEPVQEFGIIGSESPYRVLYAVRTAAGEFLVPSVNAELLTSVEQLAPGFAYRRDPQAR